MDLSGAQVFKTEVTPTWLPHALRHRRASAAILTTGAMLIDTILLLASLGLLCWLRRGDNSYSPGEVLLAGSGASLVCCLLLSRCRAYRLDRLRGISSGFGPLLAAICCAALLFAMSLYLLPTPVTNELPDIARSVGIWAAFALLFMTGARCLSAHMFSVGTVSAAMRRRVALVGVNELGRTFRERVATDVDGGIDIVGLYHDVWPDPDTTPPGTHADGDLRDLAARCQRDAIDVIVLAVSLLDIARIDRILHALRHVTADICVAADVLGLRFDIDDVEAIGRSPVVSLQRRPLDDWQLLQKAVFDRVLAGLLLLSLSPLLLLVAVLIRLDSPGSILFRQPRMGFNNRVFMVYKFRTMFSNGDPASLYGDRQATRSDPRITRVGTWLRTYSIDELPQLLNVMKGEMSLVGPRPHPLNTRVGDQLFQDAVDNYAARHRVLPGITGWAQVNGWRGETVVLEQIEQRVAHDLYYIDNWSLGLDIRILLLTMRREILSKTAF